CFRLLQDSSLCQNGKQVEIITKMIFELCYIEAIKNIAISPTRDASPPLVLALCACVPLRRVSYNLKSSQKPVSLKVYFVHPACKGKSITKSLVTLPHSFQNMFLSIKVTQSVTEVLRNV
ncbi:MAG: hypothetical protein ACM674_00185, partial [Bacteroidales bacterium]